MMTPSPLSLARLSAVLAALCAAGLLGSVQARTEMPVVTVLEVEAQAQSPGDATSGGARSDSGTPPDPPSPADGETLRAEENPVQSRKEGRTELAEHWMDIRPDTIERKTLINSEGEKLGDVTGVVRHKETGEIAAIVSIGGFLGIGWLGGEKVAVPLKRMHLQANNVILFSPVTQEDLLAQEGAYRQEHYDSIDAGTPLGELPGVVPSPQETRVATFEELDSNGDGALERSEVQAESVLMERWEEYDENEDGRLDRSEYQMFLQEQDTGETPPEV